MKRRYTILQRNLHEIENGLNQFLSLPADTPILQLYNLFSDIEQRLEFLKNLLSAEVATSHPSNTPRDLRHISRRVAQIESAFRDMYALRRTTANNPNGPTSDIDNHSIHQFDAAACSCTESSLNDNQEEEEVDSAESETFYEAVAIMDGKLSEEETNVSVDGVNSSSSSIIKREKGDDKAWILKYCLVMMASGIVITGAALKLRFYVFRCQGYSTTEQLLYQGLVFTPT